MFSVSAVLSVSVEGVSSDVSNDVFLRCVFKRDAAKYRCRLRQAQSGRDLLVSHV